MAKYIQKKLIAKYIQKIFKILVNFQKKLFFPVLALNLIK